MDDITEVPVIRLDELTDEQRRAYMLAHNKLTMNTGFDIELLNAEIELLDFDMQKLGFDVNCGMREITPRPNIEIDLESFSDERFECECPRCGFKFNKES